MLLDLPLDVAALVAAKTRIRDRLVLASTCRQLHQASRSSAWWPERKMSLTLRTAEQMKRFGRWLEVRTLPTLEIYLRFCTDFLTHYVAYAILAALESAPRLDTLVLRFDHVVWMDLEPLGDHPTLRHLCMSAKGLAHCSSLRLPGTLERLTLRNVTAVPSMNPDLAWPSRLTHLTINNRLGELIPRPEQTCAVDLARLPRLVSLDVSGSACLVSTTLRRLCIGDATHPDSVPRISLRRLPALRELAVRGDWRPSKSALQLRHLTIEVCSCRGEWARVLPHLTGLTSLELLEYRSYADDGGMYRTLAPPASLVSLHISGDTATDDAYPWLVMELAQCTRLERLDLDGVTLAEFKLKAPASLRHLCMYDCDMSPGHLTALPSGMESVCVLRCTASLDGERMRGVVPDIDLCDLPGAQVLVQNARL